MKYWTKPSRCEAVAAGIADSTEAYVGASKLVELSDSR
jgi:hypothetical protein